MKQSGGVPSEGDKRDRKGTGLAAFCHHRQVACRFVCYLAPEPASGTRPRGILATYVMTVSAPHGRRSSNWVVNNA